MCDTMVIQGENRSLFGKNSDRDPGEIQLVQFASIKHADITRESIHEHVNRYEEGSFKALQKAAQEFTHPYPALITRPAWIWGAENGVNIHGVAIGNEAVFSHGKKLNDGLLGMDILRLALHNAATAEEALGIIIQLTEKVGQGGNGSYTGKLCYDNSYLIKDTQGACVLETAGKHWAYRNVDKAASISNTYTLRKDVDKRDALSKNSSFKKQYEKKIMTFFAGGDARQAYTQEMLLERENEPDLDTMKTLLRSHMTKNNAVNHSMRSICLHSRGLVNSETTSSMIVDYYKNHIIAWVTGGPYPCVSLYKPFIISPDSVSVLKKFSDNTKQAVYAEEHAQLNKRILEASGKIQKKIQELALNYEKRFMDMIYGEIGNLEPAKLADKCRSCFQLEKEYEQEVEIVLKDEN